MNYQTSKPITGEDPGQTLKFIAGSLTAAGFTIGEWTQSSLTATGPCMMNTNQTPLRAVTRISIRLQGRNLSAEAEVGAQKMIRVLTVLFTCMIVLFALMAIFVLPDRDKHGHVMGTGARLLIAGVPLIPLVIVMPIVYRISVITGRKAVNNLLHNASIMPTQTARI